MDLQNSLPTDWGSGQPGIIVLQLMLRKTGIRHYRKYFYIYKKSNTTIKKKIQQAQLDTITCHEMSLAL